MVMSSPLELPRRLPGPLVSVLQFSDRAEAYATLMSRTERWARQNGYAYRREERRRLPEHIVYFEKVRMALESFARGADWALWVDDDATINAVQQVTLRLERLPLPRSPAPPLPSISAA